MEYRNQIVNMDALSYLRTLPDGSVNCCVTSPPYWALRDYGVPGQLGLEPTPAEYVSNMVAVFAEVYRVLRDDGTLWVNIGDTYANDTKWGGSTGGKHASALHGQTNIGRGRVETSLPPKSLVQIPARFSLAMQDFGWILRNDIIWAKPNPMPESVVDRFTKSYEHVYLFTKRPRYWSDLYAVREAAVDDASHRNARDVWTLTPEPWKAAHFAVMPGKLVERCLLAGGPETVCAVCGAPWTRVVESEGTIVDSYSPRSSGNGDRNDAEAPRTRRLLSDHGFRTTCTCGQSTVPGLALDPFMGSGTVARTAIRLRRDYCGCDLNPDYVRMATESLDGLQVRLFT